MRNISFNQMKQEIALHRLYVESSGMYGNLCDWSNTIIRSTKKPRRTIKEIIDNDGDVNGNTSKES